MMRHGIFVFRLLKFLYTSERPEFPLKNYSHLSTRKILKLNFELHLVSVLVTDEDKISASF